jgi:hypothetical protein
MWWHKVFEFEKYAIAQPYKPAPFVGHMDILTRAGTKFEKGSDCPHHHENFPLHLGHFF